jgi:hypothetical protein
VPDKDLHIQLVWTTPDDPDETDMTGTDLDLHLRHPDANGGWNSDAGQFDCYFANKTPDWGAQLDPADNPTLDIDDTNGAGPENINLAHPEAITYDVAALYFRAESALGEGAEVSIIASPYGSNGQVLGAVGVIGPTRMDYQKVIPLVGFTAQVLSKALESA